MRRKPLLTAMVSALAILPLAALVSWTLFVEAAPALPLASPSSACEPPWFGFYRSASAWIAFQSSSNKCWTTESSPVEVDQWYADLGWEFGGRVGGYWSRFHLDLGLVSIYGWRRAYSSAGPGSGASILMQMYLDIGILPI
jgi:hypothetical protein